MRVASAVCAALLLAALVAVFADPALRARIVQVRPSPPADAVQDPEAVSAQPTVAPRAAPPHVRVEAADAGSPSPQPRVRAQAAAPVVSTAPGATLSIPVQGVAADQLLDTFDQPRGDERRHEALDIMAPAGTPVLAVADGHVEKLFDSERGGLTIYQFDPHGRHAYYYAHLQDYAPGLAEKQPVRRGQLLGHVGSTGNADPSAPHLHFAVFVLGPEKRWWEGTAINPYPLMRGR